MADVYSIAMELNLDDKASEGLRGITEGMAKLVEQLGLAAEGFKGLNAAVVAGAGAGIALGLTRIMETANKFTDSMIRMRLGAIDAGRALQAAEETARIRPGTTREENLERLQMLYGFMGQGAYGELTQATRAEEMFRFMGVTGGLQATMRAAAMRGLNRPGRERELNEFIENMVRITQATGGAVSPEMMRSALARGGIPGMEMDPEMQNVILPYLLMSGIGGRMGPGQALAALESGALSSMRGGGLRGGRGGAINRQALMAYTGRAITGADVDQLATNPFEWAQNLQRTLLARNLISGRPQDAAADDERVFQQMRRIFSNPATAAMMAAFVTQGTAMLGAKSPFAQFAAQQGAALGTTPAGIAAIDESTAEKMKTVASRWHDLMVDISRADTPMFDRWLDSTKDWIVAMNDFAKTLPPENIQSITKGLGLLSGAMIALGAAGVMAAFLPGGWFTVGAFALAGTLTMLANLDWRHMQSTLDNIYNYIFNFIAKVSGIKVPDEKPPAPAIPPGSALDQLLRGFQNWTGMHVPGLQYPNMPREAPVPYLTPSPALPSGFPGIPQQKDMNVSLTLNVDGQTLASTMWQNLMQINQFPIGASASNGSAGWPSVDRQWMPR